jgi:hypothetical protein
MQLAQTEQRPAEPNKDGGDTNAQEGGKPP